MNDIPVLMSGVNRDASSKDLGWYHQEIGNLLLKEMSEILQKYSKIPVHEIEPHIHKIVRCMNSHTKLYSVTLIHVERRILGGSSLPLCWAVSVPKSLSLQSSFIFRSVAENH